MYPHPSDHQLISSYVAENRGCSLLASYSFRLFFTHRASRATFTSSTSHSLNSSSMFSSPLTSPPPHLTVLRLCSSFSPAAGLGHPVWAVSISSPWGFSHLLFFQVSCLSLSLLDRIQLFLTPRSSLFAQSLIVSVLSPPFHVFYPSCFFCLRQTEHQCVTSGKSPIYVFDYIYMQPHNRLLIMQLIDFS